MKLLVCLLIAVCLVPGVQAQFSADQSSSDMGFLDRPPIYIGSDPDFPLADFTADMPPAGATVPDLDISSVESDGWNKDGDNVQPSLRLNSDVYRIGGMHGFDDGWAAGLAVPWVRTKVQGAIGGLPAFGVGEGLGDVVFYGKKLIGGDGCNTKLVVSAGIEVPTGKDDATFSTSNASTRGYFRGPSPRLPLGWQAGTGTFDGYLAVAYARRVCRISYGGVIAAKLNGTGDQDVHVGNVLLAAVSGTYAVRKNIALSLGLTLRTQGDDDYPDSPLPVEGFLLRGTTTHGTTLFLTPSIRVKIANRITVGVGVKYPITEPENGMVPRVDFSFIAYPSL